MTSRAPGHPRWLRPLAPVGAVGVILGVAVAWYAFWRAEPVTTVLPQRGDAAEIVYASGVVEPRVWAKVTTLMRERIVEICSCEGEPVERGAVLARLDDNEARAALDESEARLALAREDLRRRAVLAERNTASRSSLEEAQSAVVQLEALVAGNRAHLDDFVLTAPEKGVVLKRDGEVGEIAEPGEALFWVGQPKPLIVVADVNEEDIPRVQVGQEALLRSDAFPGQALPATVDSITPKGDPVTKTYRVRLALPADTPLLIGMSTDVNIVERVVHDALLVPTVAVEGDRVFVAEDGRARLRTVTTGISGAGGVHILDGITERDRIISPFPAGLAEGARIVATPAAVPGSGPAPSGR